MDDRYYIEAILPLKRMPDGSLGIVAHTANANPDPDIVRMIMDKAVDDVNRSIMGGGATYKVMRKRFGASE